MIRNRLRRSACLLLVGTSVWGCGPAPETVAGYVTAVESTSLTEVQTFTLETPEGERLVFQVGAVELDGGAFPPNHLRQHMALGQGVAVGYRMENGERMAFRLVDATWLQP